MEAHLHRRARLARSQAFTSGIARGGETTLPLAICAGEVIALAEPVIATYRRLPLACRDYDPRAPEVAARAARLIRAACPEVAVEHVGSTAVPGCAGKGVVDLMVLYPAGRLEAVKEALATLGFQPQAGPNRWGCFDSVALAGSR